MFQHGMSFASQDFMNKPGRKGRRMGRGTGKGKRPGRGGIEAELEKVGRIAGLLWDKGWAERNAGNISVNVTGLAMAGRRRAGRQAVELRRACPALSGAQILISGTGSRMRDVAADPGRFTCLVRIPEGGSGFASCDPGPAGMMPSSELPAHLAVHELLASCGRPEKAVIHTHPGKLIALSHCPALGGEGRLDAALRIMHPEVSAVYPEGIGFAPYETPGSEELALACVKALESRRIVMWEKHGVVAVGATLDDAFDAIDTMEKAANLYLDCLAAGFEPEGLSEGQLETLRAAFGRSRA